MGIEVDREVAATEGIVYGRLSVGTDAQRLTVPSTVDRTGKLFKGVLIRNLSDTTIFVGGPTVSTASGFPVDSKNFLELPVDDASKIYVIADDVDLPCAWIGV